MAIKYLPAPDIEEKARHIAEKTEIKRDFSRIHFIRSHGSSSRRTVARCHTIPKVIQKAMEIDGHYVIEVISEHFDKMNEKEKTKTIIHELLHIPKGMKGGFRQHDFVCEKNVDDVYRSYVNLKRS